jgi:hypothetical protein
MHGYPFPNRLGSADDGPTISIGSERRERSTRLKKKFCGTTVDLMTRKKDRKHQDPDKILLIGPIEGRGDPDQIEIHSLQSCAPPSYNHTTHRSPSTAPLSLSDQSLRCRISLLSSLLSSSAYHPDLLAPYLALPQGNSIQAECMCGSPHYLFFGFLICCSNRCLD